VDSGTDGFLTADTAITGLPTGTQAWVYMCGPPAMTTALSAGFHKLKIPSSRIRWEQFNVR
jgi:predicted ferric reductase